MRTVSKKGSLPVFRPNLSAPAYHQPCQRQDLTADTHSSSTRSVQLRLCAPAHSPAATASSSTAAASPSQRPRQALACFQDGCEAVHAVGDGLEALRAMVHSVHARNVGQQGLCGADVGRRLVAPDVLLARLHRHAQRRLVAGVAADACSPEQSQPTAVHWLTRLSERWSGSRAV